MFYQIDDNHKFDRTITVSWLCFFIADFCGLSTLFIDTVESISYLTFILLTLMFIFLGVGIHLAHLRSKQLRYYFLEQKYQEQHFIKNKMQK